MKKKYDVLLIDISNVYHRSYNSCIKRGFTNKKLYQKTVEQTLISIKSLENKFLWEWGKVYCLFDNPTSRVNLRSELSSDYKLLRKKMPKLFYDYLNYLKTLLLSLNSRYKLAYVDLLEADDLVLPIVKLLSNRDSVMLISADLDWSRSIFYDKRDIVWYNFKKVFDKEEFKIDFGFPPTVDKIVLFKCLSGDSSDGISKAVRGLPKKDIEHLCTDFNSIEEVFASLRSISYLSQTFKYRIEENIEQLKINKTLIEFIDINKFGNIENYIFDCSFKFNELKLFYAGLEIKLPNYLKPKREFKEASLGLFKLDRLPRK